MRVAVIHLDLGIGDAEQLVVNVCTGLLEQSKLLQKAYKSSKKDENLLILGKKWRKRYILYFKLLLKSIR